MNNADHDLALVSFQAMHSVLWRIVTGMEQWSNAPFDERWPEEINYSALEAEIQPQLTLLHAALQQFPKQSFDLWKEEVLQDLSDDPFFTGAANSVLLENRPQGVALSCDRAWTETNDGLNDILLRLGARGWPGILSAWESIRDKLYVVEHHLCSAIEQLTMNPMFAVYLRERALRMIHGESEATTGEDADSSECETAAAPCTGEAESDVIGNESATARSDPSSVKTVAVSDADAEAEAKFDADALDIANTVIADGATDDDDDETATSDSSTIPSEYRTRPLGKTEAAAWLGKFGDSGRRWLNQCIRDESIVCVRMTRQSYIFDLRDFPEAAIFRIKPREPGEGNSRRRSKALSPTNSDAPGTTPE